MNYHAHIYWHNIEERNRAMEVRTYLHDNGCALGRIWDKPIGPHPLPMYQVMYDSSNKSCIESYLSNTNLNILLHEDIGLNHVRDHTEGARWIGPSQDLDLDFLRQIDMNDL
jgi:DOPA 4,5-dioxygenase